MSYKIAIASSDGVQIDESFGSAKKFMIFEISDSIQKTEERNFHQESATCNNTCNENKCGNGNGCGGNGEISPKVELLSDCRCIVCTKIGFPIQKQLERKAISAFDVNCSVKEALNKITAYYTRIDNHESLRK